MRTRESIDLLIAARKETILSIVSAIKQNPIALHKLHSKLDSLIERKVLEEGIRKFIIDATTFPYPDGSDILTIEATTIVLAEILDEAGYAKKIQDDRVSIAMWI
jgi:hypothetical protein